LARYDKYDPISGGFRAIAGEDLAVGTYGVRLNSSGKVIKSGGTDGIDGVFVNPDGVAQRVIKTGEAVDVMTAGEIVGLSGLAAGTDYYATITTGAITATATNNPKIGVTAEADRLIVRV